MLSAMAIDPGDAVILAYVLVSIGVLIVSLLAALPIEWLVVRLRARRRRRRDGGR
jgi:Flp pilus assembly protein TadB